MSHSSAASMRGNDAPPSAPSGASRGASDPPADGILPPPRAWTRRQWLKGAAALLAGSAAAGGGYAYYHRKRYKHFAVHDDGLVYRSAWLEPDVFAELIETHQIRTIVNLCKPGEMGDERWAAQRETVARAGAQLLEIPMPQSAHVDDATVERYLAVLRNPDSYPLLVHCQHGVTRTADFLVMYDILLRGMTAEESLSRMPLFGRDDHNIRVKLFARDFERNFGNRTESGVRARLVAPMAD